MATSLQLYFVTAVPESKSSRREYELQISNIRSHAGRLAHARRRMLSSAEHSDLPILTKQQGPVNAMSLPWSSHGTRLNAMIPQHGVVASGEAEVLELEKRQTHNKSSWQWSKGARVDPFNCIPGGSQGTAQVALDFLAVTKWCWPSYACMNDALRLNSNFQYRWLLDQMAQHRMLFHIVVAHMEACRTLLLHPKTLPTPESEFHKRQAITALRQELADPMNGIKDAVIATTAYLSLHEASVGDNKLAAFHRQKMGDLVAVRGGLTTLPSGSGIRSLVMMFQACVGNFLQESQQRSGTIPANPMSRSQFQTINGLPAGFLAIALRGTLSMETIDVILKIAKKNFWASRQPHSLSRILIDDVDEKFSNMEEACPALVCSETRPGLAFEKLLCIAMMRTSIDHTQRFVGVSSVFIALSYRIIQLLPEIISTSEEPERSCLLWISLSLIDTWPHDIQQTRSWLRQTFMSFSEIESWEAENFEQFGQRYIWTRNWSDMLANTLSWIDLPRP